jgi:hypothetical protein
MAFSVGLGLAGAVLGGVGDIGCPGDVVAVVVAASAGLGVGIRSSKLGMGLSRTSQFDKIRFHGSVHEFLGQMWFDLQIFCQVNDLVNQVARVD